LSDTTTSPLAVPFPGAAIAAPARLVANAIIVAEKTDRLSSTCEVTIAKFLAKIFFWADRTSDTTRSDEYPLGLDDARAFGNYAGICV
jgi:hypothetical protein